MSTAVDRIISKGRIRRDVGHRDITPRDGSPRVGRMRKVVRLKVAGLGLMRPSVEMSGMESIIPVGHARAVVTGMDVSAGCEAWFFLT